MAEPPVPIVIYAGQAKPDFYNCRQFAGLFGRSARGIAEGPIDGADWSCANRVIAAASIGLHVETGRRHVAERASHLW